MNREEAFREINETQDFYVNELIKMLESSEYKDFKEVYFTSPTGTGKTKMISKLINKMPDYFFVVTTLSKGQLDKQTKKSLENDCYFKNFIVYGAAEYKKNSKLTEEDILGKIPSNKKVVWIKDEGHILTNNFEKLFKEICFKKISVSATNQYEGINCNFSHTMMLRTVEQIQGSYKEALDKLQEIKINHKNVSNYNPCAILRCINVDESEIKEIKKYCDFLNFKYIDISDENYDMSDLCKDDNEYDVIINKLKLTEGVDLRRAHVIWMNNKPKNPATTIQAVGRCRRNALLYRDDIDILSEENETLLRDSRMCYFYFEKDNSEIALDQDGNFQIEFCKYITCENLKPNTVIEVKNGELFNGLNVLELEGKTGKFEIIKDEETGFNWIPLSDFYEKEIMSIDFSKYYYISSWMYEGKVKKEYKDLFPLVEKEGKLYRNVWPYWHYPENVQLKVSNEVINYVSKKTSFYRAFFKRKYKNNCIDALEKEDLNFENLKKENITMKKTIEKMKWTKRFWNNIKKIEELVRDENEKDIILNFLYRKKTEKASNEDITKYVREIENRLSVIHQNIGIFSDDKILYYTVIKKSLNQNIKSLTGLLWRSPFEDKVDKKWNDFSLTIEELDEMYERFETTIDDFVANSILLISFKDFWLYLKQEILLFKNKVINNEIIIRQLDYSELFEPLNIVETRFLNCNHKKDDVKVIFNDKETAIIGVEKMKQMKLSKEKIIWVEDSSITSKTSNYNKLSSFINYKYSKEIENVENKLFSGKNDFKLPKNANSWLGTCVEYYSKYLIYGDQFLDDYYLKKTSEKLGIEEFSPANIIHNIMSVYQEETKMFYEESNSKIPKKISVEILSKENFKEFLELVQKMGEQTESFIREKFNDDELKQMKENNLSIKHIKGKADYIIGDTIIDIKVTNHINKNMIWQVLMYHYLSTKRSDLNIRRVIVYDATSGKHVEVNIEKENLTDFSAFEN